MNQQQIPVVTKVAHDGAVSALLEQIKARDTTIARQGQELERLAAMLGDLERELETVREDLATAKKTKRTTARKRTGATGKK